MLDRPLYVAAAIFELQPLIDRIPDIETYVFGIGALETESQSAQIQEKTMGRDVIYVGTCGTLREWQEPYLVSPHRTSWLPLCERLEQSWALPEMPTLECESFEGLKRAHVLCSTTIAKTSEIANSVVKDYDFALSDDTVENLEIYNFLRHAKCRRFRAVLGVSNRVCSEGRNQWKQHFKSLAQQTADFLEKAVT